MKEVKVAYGKQEISLKIPTEYIIDTLQPEEGAPLMGLQAEVINRLNSPTDSSPLAEMVGKESRVVIIVDDNTRPTPTKEILEPLLDILFQKGVKKNNISIIFALGAHSKLNEKEKLAIVGPKIYQNITCKNHLVEEENLVYIGKTTFGTPVYLNKEVYEADIRILTGMIKPHNQAGYTGGGKALLPGVCGLDTIFANHSYKAMSSPASCLGNIEGNPIRMDIEEVLKKIGPTFLINVVMNHKDQVVAVVAGGVIAAHREGVRRLDSLVKKDVNKKAAICICGTPDPIDINFYQMLNSISAPYRLKEPVIEKGGTIIVTGRAIEGISDGDFYIALKENERESLWLNIQGNSQYQERAALQIFLEGACNYKIIVVSEKNNQEKFKEMGMEFFQDLETAYRYARSEYPGDKNTLILPYAPYVIPQLITEK
ncbi:MAG: lactate racemase [Halanaerobiales bacterium]|nr:lactate racemase [Halanaerobiales bacterium]